MTTSLLSILSLATIASTLSILIVLLLRPVMRRAFGPRAAYALWLLPLAALAAGLLPPAASPSLLATPAAAIARVAAPAIDTSRALPAPVAGPSGEPRSMPPAIDRTVLMLGLWLLGAVVSAGALLVRQRRFVTGLGALRRSVVDGTTLFYASDAASGPALVGAINPKVVVPSDFDERYTPEERALVVAHERAHLRRADPSINAVVAGLRCAFWFNPIVHLGARALRLDQELACDAATIAQHPDARRRYAEAMLKTQFAAAGAPMSCYWPAQGQHPLMRRIALLKKQATPAQRRAGAVVVLALIGMTAFTARAAQAPEPIASLAVNASIPAASALPTPPAHQPLPAPVRRHLAPMVRAVHNTIYQAASQVGLLHGSASVIDSAQRNNVRAVREALDAGGNANEVRSGDGSPLIEAARRGNLEIVTLLLDRGADPNLAVRGDGNPLIMAAERGRLSVVEALVARGADVDGYVPGDETPLINAAGRGHLDVVRYLVERGANPNLAYDVDSSAGATERRSPLGQAERFGHRDVAEYLRAAGARP